MQEARRRIELGLRRPELIVIVDDLIAEMTIVPTAALAPAERALRDAVARRNGAVGDAHVLALAWCVDADVWTTDRDFAGTGVASWSTSHLMHAIAAARET